MKKVYIAGKLNSDACGYIQNVHRMIQSAEQVRKAGFAVFVPGLDFLQGVVLGNWEYRDYFGNSQPWLDAADAIFLTPGWQTSEGTKQEIERAKARSIPVFDDLNELVKQLGDMR
jgi:hypothetical protein